MLSGKEGERSCFNLAWIYGDEREVQGVDLLFSERRISCVYTGALWAWTQLSSGGGSVACTCGFLQAVCGRSFICGKDSEKEHKNLKLYLFGHSMGGGIAAAAVAAKPKLFERLVLSSPMIRPLSGKVPWHDARTIATAFCKAGQAKRYVAGQKPYSGPRRFENSSSTSRVRYEYYRAKKEKEPLFQMNAASYGWLHAAACLNRDLQRDGVRRIRIPVILFQSEHDHLVSKKEQVRFILKLNQNGNTYAKLVRVPGTRHEIWGADEKILRGYLGMIFRFLSGQK